MRRKDSVNRQFVQRVPKDVAAKAAGTKLTLTLPTPGGTALVQSATVGKTVVKFSLRTADASLAKVRQAAALAQISAHYDAVRRRPRSLTTREVAALAGQVYTDWTRASQEDPVMTAGQWQGIADDLEQDIATAGWFIPRIAKRAPDESDRDERRKARVGGLVDVYLSKHALIVDAESRTQLLRLVAQRMIDASRTLARRAAYDYGPDPILATIPAWASTPKGEASAATYSGLWDAYSGLPGKRGAKRSATLKAYRRVFLERLVPFLEARGRLSPGQVERQDISAWRDALLSDGLGASTVARKYLAAVKAVLSRAYADGRIVADPSAGVDVPGGGVKRDGAKRSMPDDVAAAILLATRSASPGRRPPHVQRAIRWLPWLAAYTGARAAELAQLRREDFKTEGGRWCVTITPDAGSTKNDRARTIPLHRELEREGFVGLIEGSSVGPLFLPLGIPTPRAAWAAGKSAGKVRDWIRALPGFPPGIQPFHGFRHRFATEARRCGMDPEKREAILGHASRSVAGLYGDMVGLEREIDRLPPVPGAAP